MSKYRTVRSWMNFLALQKYGIFFMLLLVFFPFSAYSKASWGYALFAGMFLELAPLQIFWFSLAHFMAAWTLMYNQGILTDEAEPINQADAADNVPTLDFGPLPKKAADFFNVSVVPKQLLLYSMIPVPGAIFVIYRSETSWYLGLSAFLLALVAGYLGMIAACIPAMLLDSTFQPLPKFICAPVRRIFPWLGWVARFFGMLYSWFRWCVSFRLFDYMHDEHNSERPLIRHFFATTNAAVTFILILFVSSWFNPMQEVGSAYFRLPGAQAYFFVMIGLVIWIFGALQFHLCRFRISPLAFLGVILIIGYPLFKRDHYFRAMVKDTNELPPQLLPVEVAAASQRPENLVVVTCTGGGILASAWLTLGLQNLIEKRPELAQEIRLLSTVSGGSVGAAYYVDGMLRYDTSSNEKLAEANQQIFKSSTASSLVAPAFGLAILDLPRLASAGFLPWDDMDRGLLLEKAWEKIAQSNGHHETPVYMSEFLPAIREGKIPGFIFGSTAMEVGRRIMLTPLSFPDEDRQPSYTRALTLSEFYFCRQAKQVDMKIWAGARMSASFPYVTPAAQVKFDNAQTFSNTQNMHLVDGGYYDNYGVTSMLDWLTPVLEAKLEQLHPEIKKDKNAPSTPELKFQKVLIIQLRAFKPTDPQVKVPSDGGVAALAGPILALTSAYSGAALTRNDIVLHRYINDWNKLFKGDVELKTVEMTRPSDTGALSWHLTQAQINELKQEWPTYANLESKNRILRDNWDRLQKFLETPLKTEQGDQQ